MMKLSVAILFLVSAAAHADVDAYFATGVLEVPWGASVQQTRAAHPGGMVWPNRNYNADEGHIYEAVGEFRPLGLNHPARHVQFIFSRDDKLIRVSIHLPYADRDEVLYGIAQVLGQDYEVRDEKFSRIYSWKAGRHSDVELVISNDPSRPWAYLYVRGR